MSSYQSYSNGMDHDGYGGGNRGGGFQSSPSARGGGFQNSPGAQASGEKKQRREGQSLTPVTIRQILECENRDTKFKLDGKELAPITIVGAVIQVDIKATNINYTVDDGTGIINVRIYIDQDDDAGKRNVVAEHTYIRVFGNVRLLGDQRNIVAYQAIPITDHNEISYHMLDALHTHLLNTKGQRTGEPGQTYAQPGSTSHDVPMTTTSSSSMTSHVNAPASDFTPIQQQVLRIFEQDSAASGDSGTSIQTVITSLPHLSQRDIEAAIEFLSNEGHLYSTIDENHFKSTAAS